jgi:hypothetical protein
MDCRTRNVLHMYNSDPQDDVPFAKVLYNSDKLVRALYQGMTENGVIVMQLGGSPFEHDPPDIVTASKNRALMTDILAQAGFKSIHVYEEVSRRHVGTFFFVIEIYLLLSLLTFSKSLAVFFCIGAQ